MPYKHCGDAAAFQVAEGSSILPYGSNASPDGPDSGFLNQMWEFDSLVKRQVEAHRLWCPDSHPAMRGAAINPAETQPVTYSDA